jgi:hypothetical protein
MSCFPKLRVAGQRSKRRSAMFPKTGLQVFPNGSSRLHRSSLKRADGFKKPVRRKFQHSAMPCWTSLLFCRQGAAYGMIIDFK